MTDSEPPAAFRVLVVCTGNLCRSPAAERLLSLALDAAVEVESAGLGAVEGYRIAPEMASLLVRAGAGAGGFHSRPLSPQMLSGAELILALTRAQRAAIVERAPWVVRRSFTLTEFARLLGDRQLPVVPAANASDCLRELTRQASAWRHAAKHPDSDDIADPYGGTAETYERAFAEISAAVDAIRRTVLRNVGTSVNDRRPG